MKHAYLAFVIILLIQGCSAPTTTVRTTDSRPTISVAGARENADLFVDGIRMGKAVDFENPKQLRLDAGTHRISIVEANRTVFEQAIFIESEHKTITVR